MSDQNLDGWPLKTRYGKQSVVCSADKAKPSIKLFSSVFSVSWKTRKGDRQVDRENFSWIKDWERKGEAKYEDYDQRIGKTERGFGFFV